MNMYKGKKLDEMSKTELDDYQTFISNTIEQLEGELNLSSSSKARDAAMRLEHYEKRQSELNSFLENQR